MPSPLSTQFPLKGIPFYSRISDQLTSDPIKNYYAIAFNPGFPLQASELNELQEIFFINNTLSTQLPVNWLNLNYKSPYWEGLVPLSPSYINITNTSSSGGSWIGTITINSGWYYWTEPTSKLKFWIYLDSSITGSFTIPVGQSRYFGLRITNETIKCCSSDTCSEDQDADIRDNSSGFPGSYLTCGASRLKATIIEEIDIRNTNPTETDWSFIFQIDTNDVEITAFYTNNTNTFGYVTTSYTAT
jgi:hypothetical protein